jgi:hypothetical protein
MSRKRIKHLAFLLFASAAALFSFSCTTIPVEETRGTLVITNIPSEFNGMYIDAGEVFGHGSNENYISGYHVYAGESINTKGRATPGLIQDGKAVLSVWQLITKRAKNGSRGVYNYNATGPVLLRFNIMYSGKPHASLLSSGGTSYDDSLDTATINFVNGNAVYNYVDIVEDTVGELTVLNIPADYNGKFVWAMPSIGEGAYSLSYPHLIAFHSIDANDPFSALCGVVENGTLSLRVWLRNTRQRLNYDRTESITIDLRIHESRSFDYLGGGSYRSPVMRRIKVNFVDGKAVYSW